MQIFDASLILFRDLEIILGSAYWEKDHDVIKVNVSASLISIKDLEIIVVPAYSEKDHDVITNSANLCKEDHNVIATSIESSEYIATLSKTFPIFPPALSLALCADKNYLIVNVY